MTRRHNSPPTALVIVLAALAGLMTAALLMDWMVVDVHATETAGESTHVWVPVPVAALRMAAALIPRDAFPTEEVPPEIHERLPAIRTALQDLSSCPDVQLASVESPDGKVTVLMHSGRLIVDVNSPDAKVHATVPLRRLARAMKHWDGKTVDASLVRAGLAALDDGFEVKVDSPEARVRITVH